jgi:hypothetical protein
MVATQSILHYHNPHLNNTLSTFLSILNYHINKMKAFFRLGALAALCQSVYSLENGRYTIGSAITGGALVLTAHSSSPDIPLDFTENHGDSSQVWNFSSRDGQYFLIRNQRGSYINCEEGSVCYTGGYPQEFIPEFRGDGKYELVAQGSGLFLSADDQGQLLLLGYDQSPNEQFFLSPVPAQGKLYMQPCSEVIFTLTIY